MRQAVIEFFELIARTVGIRASYEPLGQSLLVIGAIIATVVAAAWWTGRITSGNPTEDDGGLVLRGGFLLVFYGGLALIFMAAIIWAWRTLFG